MRAFTVELSRIPRWKAGEVEAPRPVVRIFTATIPFEGTVNVRRRFVVSIAVIAEAAVVAKFASVLGS
jgi:hypothetical protein